MPIYEFSCPHCKMIFQFRSKTADTEKLPPCPRCAKTDMKRLFSAFSIGSMHKSGSDEGPDVDGDMGVDGAFPDDPFLKMSPQQRAKAEAEMMQLLAKADSLDESDPRQLGHFLEKMTDITGDIGGPKIKEFIRRLKSGEDPEKLEEEFGELMDVEGLGGAPGEMGEGPYGYDSSLYDM